MKTTSRKTLQLLNDHRRLLEQGFEINASVRGYSVAYNGKHILSLDCGPNTYHLRWHIKLQMFWRHFETAISAAKLSRFYKPEQSEFVTIIRGVT